MVHCRLSESSGRIEDGFVSRETSRLGRDIGRVREKSKRSRRKGVRGEKPTPSALTTALRPSANLQIQDVLPMRLGVGDADAHLFGLTMQHLDGRGTRLQRTPHFLGGDPRRQPKQRDVLISIMLKLIIRANSSAHSYIFNRLKEVFFSRFLSIDPYFLSVSFFNVLSLMSFQLVHIVHIVHIAHKCHCSFRVGYVPTCSPERWRIWIVASPVFA